MSPKITCEFRRRFWIDFWPDLGPFGGSKSITNWANIVFGVTNVKNRKTSKHHCFSCVFSRFGLATVTYKSYFPTTLSSQKLFEIPIACRTLFWPIWEQFWSHYLVTLEPFWRLGEKIFLTENGGKLFCGFWAKNVPKNHLRISTSILDRFLIRFGTIWGLKIDHKLSKSRLRSYKRQKSKNLPKPLFLRCFFKVWVSKSHLKIILFRHIIFSKIIWNSCRVSDSILTNLGAVWEPLFGHFGVLWAARGENILDREWRKTFLWLLGQKCPQKSLANFDVDFGSIFDQIWDHLGAQNPSQIEQISSSELQTSKIEKPPNTTVFPVFFQGLGWQQSLTNHTFPPHYLLKNYLKFLLRVGLYFDQFGSSFGAIIWSLWSPFGGSGKPWSGFGWLWVSFGVKFGVLSAAWSPWVSFCSSK